MNDRERDKFTMFNGVASTNKKFDAVVKSVPMLSSFNDELVSSIDMVGQYDIMYTTLAKGSTEQKNAAKLLLAGVLFRRVRTLTAYAKVTGNKELQSNVDFTESQFRALGNDAIALKATYIIDKLNSLKEQLIPYGLLDSSISSLVTSRSIYVSMLDNKQSSKKSSVIARSDLTQFFENTDELLSKMDDVVA